MHTAPDLTIDPAWLAALHHRSQQPPREYRMPLLAKHGDRWWRMGSLTGSFMSEMRRMPSLDINSVLQIHEQSASGEPLSWRVLPASSGGLTQSLNDLAAALHQHGLAGAWRNEQLAVVADDGSTEGLRLGSIERAAVRPFGIATQAVHLLAFTPDGRQWVQQRAHDKPNDPSKWDTTMGGMVSADNTLHQALVRETWEEAGLHIHQLHDLRHGGHVSLSKPSADGKGLGYLEERIDWFSAVLPDGLVPQNQDGEVAQFACLAWPDVIAGLHRGDYTDEAALILVQAHGARQHAPSGHQA